MRLHATRVTHARHTEKAQCGVGQKMECVEETRDSCLCWSVLKRQETLVSVLKRLLLECVEETVDGVC